MFLTGADRASSQDHAVETSSFEARPGVVKRQAACAIDRPLPVSLFSSRISSDFIWAGEFYRSAFAPRPSPYITGLRLCSQSSSFDWDSRGSRFVSGPRRYRLPTAPPLSPRTDQLRLTWFARLISSPYRCLLRRLPVFIGTPARYETKPKANWKSKPDRQS